MAVEFTYEDFEKKLNESGVLLSDSDMKLARQNPNAGISILNYKQEYNAAATPEQKAKAHAGAEEIRTRHGGYTGGADGSKYYFNGSSGEQEKARSLGINFVNPEKPEYSGYDYENDPVFKAYKDAYEREGARAAEDTLGRVSQQTGGMASSYAASAAAQQEQYYAKQIADMIPQLEQNAYNRYLTKLEQYNTDRSFEYGKALDIAQLGMKKDEQDYSRAQADKLEAQAMVNGMLEDGNMPSDELLGRAGLSREYANSKIEKYNRNKADNITATLYNAGIIDEAGLKAMGYTTEQIEELKKIAETGKGAGGTPETPETPPAWDDAYRQMYEDGITTESSARAYLATQGFSEDQINTMIDAYMNDLIPKYNMEKQQEREKQEKALQDLYDQAHNALIFNDKPKLESLLATYEELDSSEYDYAGMCDLIKQYIEQIDSEEYRSAIKKAYDIIGRAPRKYQIDNKFVKRIIEQVLIEEGIEHKWMQ